jgi:hypothetical protein
MSAGDLDPGDLPDAVEKFRQEWLFCTETGHLCPEAEQFYLMALAALEQAQRYAALSQLAQRRALAERTRP